jgi:hypothetical protein
MKGLIIVPAYNEENNIENIIEELWSGYSNYDFLIINDGSTDNSIKILKKCIKRKNCVRGGYVDIPVNLGIGGCVQTGYIYALEKGYDIAIQIDGDGQHDLRYLDALTEPIIRGEADICIGSRFLEGKGFQSNISRRIGIAFLSRLIFYCTGKQVLDVTSGFRAVGKKYIEFFAKDYPQDYPEPETIVSAVNAGARIAEIPVEMRERQSGISSINVKRSIYYMLKVSLSIIFRTISSIKTGRKLNDNN